MLIAKKIYSYFLIIIFFCLPLQFVYAADDSFPFNKPCLVFNKEIFKVEGNLIEVMKEGDFPQYCVLYSLSNYQVEEKWDNGYFMAGPTGEAEVFIRTTVTHKKDQILKGEAADIQKPVGQWAYFIGPDRFTMDNGQDKELYVFQEIDF